MGSLMHCGNAQVGLASNGNDSTVTKEHYFLSEQNKSLISSQKTLNFSQKSPED